MQNPAPPGAFKSQPWILYDSVASLSFLLGDTDNPAIGGSTPAISRNGEITFFQTAGRCGDQMPWYCNLDQAGQLSYGFEVWQMYLLFAMPTWPPAASVSLAESTAADNIVPGTVKLVESILNFGVLEMNLGQEQQLSWPCTRFGAGGGLAQNAFLLSSAQNSMPQGANVMKMPEPIQMPRTQNLSAKIRIAPEAFSMIGSLAAPGVGSPLSAYPYITVPGETPTIVDLDELPFMVQLGLVGRRIKDTQYGQLPASQQG